MKVHIKRASGDHPCENATKELLNFRGVFCDRKIEVFVVEVDKITDLVDEHGSCIVEEAWYRGVEYTVTIYDGYME